MTCLWGRHFGCFAKVISDRIDKLPCRFANSRPILVHFVAWSPHSLHFSSTKQNNHPSRGIANLYRWSINTDLVKSKTSHHHHFWWPKVETILIPRPHNQEEEDASRSKGKFTWEDWTVGKHEWSLGDFWDSRQRSQWTGPQPHARRWRLYLHAQSLPIGLLPPIALGSFSSQWQQTTQFNKVLVQTSRSWKSIASMSLRRVDRYLLFRWESLWCMVGLRRFRRGILRFDHLLLPRWSMVLLFHKLTNFCIHITRSVTSHQKDGWTTAHTTSVRPDQIGSNPTHSLSDQARKCKVGPFAANTAENRHVVPGRMLVLRVGACNMPPFPCDPRVPLQPPARAGYPLSCFGNKTEIYFTLQYCKLKKFSF